MELLKVNIQKAGYDKKGILSDVAFSIHKGELVGLIGDNGAGKSTTIKSILGFLKSVEGSIEFVETGHYAYVPEHPSFYDELTLWEHIDLAASVMEIDESVLKKRSEELLKTFKLKHVIHEIPNTFSKGMQQKVMLILAFLIQPYLFIVDEPFIGLDPNAMKDFIHKIQVEKQRGAGILMSTHVLDTAEKHCDRFLLMKGGTIVAQGTLQDLQSLSGLKGGTLFDCYNALSEDTDVRS
ncbi:ABC transporter ATP-binding protein [Alkalihalobacillus sp. AL-G]|uniref:ABC transporter ATP-binding protein n=1 Tax=Alkalihalobacillus sp. AL-G TaxID=2926399 RepID=UPI00272B4784|nr:ABC transporter ATP-binding protein [Alkalihalobacillus sp. AL-G]WLD94693.1 ABC transporter ATP-binding protein [Alkalihalobacillus sp. AL-G]